jgi:S-DNA-T family DNA segregation ATPase FtsK/SpoIIIE
LFGWGAYLAVFMVAAAGLLLIAQRFTDRLGLLASQVVGFEIAFFAILGILHSIAWEQDPLRVAAAGRGGGYVGWGISLPFQAVLGEEGAIIALVVCMGAGWLLAARISGRDLARAGTFARDELLLLWERMQPDREPSAPAQVVRPRPAPTVKPVAPAPPSKAAATRKPAPTGEEPRKEPKEPKKEKRAPTPAGARDPRLPPLELLRADAGAPMTEEDIEEKSAIILDTLASFGIPARIVSVNRGPTVTQFGVEPGFVRKRDEDGNEVLRKVRVSRIHALSNDLALALAATSIRIEAPVPGQPYVGIEVPNAQTQLVSLRGVMESEAFRKIRSPLAIPLGRDVSGAPVAADLAAMPHLLIAGATGSGKSVCINAIVTGLLCQNHPETLRLLMIDPKRVELTGYNSAPHLLAPVVVDLEQVVGALHWVVKEMGLRYERFAAAGARHLTDYNQRVSRRGEAPLPYLVVIVDELADLMMLAPDEVERSICRIAQMARATGIHLIIATQRPSVDVVTGLIKANFPARIAFAVTSQVDSRVILDSAGAEKLLGRGDMLFMAPDASKLSRLQGCYVSDKEIHAVVSFWQRSRLYEAQAAGEAEAPAGEPANAYPWEADEALNAEDGDALFDQAVGLLRGKDTISTSYIQRALRIGYPRAARLMDLLEQHGYVGVSQGGGKSRDVLIQPED